MLFLLSLLLLGTAVLGQLPVDESEVQLNRQKRIVGGDYLPVHHVPHQAMIRQIIEEEYYQCGAVLIAPQWLLTAEHCLISSDITEHPIYVFLGVSEEEQIDHYYAEWAESVVWRRVVRYFRGPRVEIGNRTQKSDLLLLKLDWKVETTPSIAPIELPEVGERFTNQIAVTSGFGQMHHNQYHPSNFEPRTLQYVKVAILSKSHCLEIFRQQEELQNIYKKLRLAVAPETILCAGNAEVGHDICSGDSGGPLAVCVTPLQETTSGQLMCKDNRWKLAGVVLSSYDPCGATPASYANVPVFSDWIRKTIRNN